MNNTHRNNCNLSSLLNLLQKIWATLFGKTVKVVCSIRTIFACSTRSKPILDAVNSDEDFLYVRDLASFKRFYGTCYHCNKNKLVMNDYSP